MSVGAVMDDERTFMLYDEASVCAEGVEDVLGAFEAVAE